MFNTKKFDLVVTEPVSGKPGRFVFGLSIHAENVSSAVRGARKMVEGSGLMVFQRSAYDGAQAKNLAVLDALADAYERKFGE